MTLPYAGEKGENIVRKMKKTIASALNKKDGNVRTRITYHSKKLSTKFILKDKTKLQHRHNIVYHAKCPNEKCSSHYIGQTSCRLGKRATQHNRTDQNSHVLKHSKSKRHKRVWLKDFQIMGSRYNTDFKRRISESLYVKKVQPDLNMQKDAFKLTLFN